MKFILSIVMVSFVLSGCASTPSIVTYPDFAGEVGIHVSKDSLKWSEQAAYDEHIENSQVFILHPNTGVGLIGGVLGAIIENKMKAKSDIGELDRELLGSKLQVYFDNEVTEGISKIVLQKKGKHYPTVEILDDISNADFKLIPFVRIIPRKNNTVSIGFHLKTLFFGSSKKPLSKHYSFYPETGYSSTGDEGLFQSKGRLNEISETAFERLLILFFDDMVGKLVPNEEAELSFARLKPDQFFPDGQRVAVLRSDSDYSVYSKIFRSGVPDFNYIAVGGNALLTHDSQ